MLSCKFLAAFSSSSFVCVCFWILERSALCKGIVTDQMHTFELEDHALLSKYQSGLRLINALQNAQNRRSYGRNSFIYALQLGRELQELGVVLIDNGDQLLNTRPSKQRISFHV